MLNLMTIRYKTGIMKSGMKESYKNTLEGNCSYESDQ